MDNTMFVVMIIAIALSKIIFDNLWISLIVFILYDIFLYYEDERIIANIIKKIDSKKELEEMIDHEIRLYVKGENVTFKNRSQIDEFIKVARKHEDMLNLEKSKNNDNKTDEIVEMIEGRLKEDVNSLHHLNNSFINILKNEEIINTGLISNKDNDKIISLVKEIEKVVSDDNYKVNIFYSKYKNFVEELMRLLKAYEKSNNSEKYKTEMKNIVDNFIEYLVNLKERIQMNEEVQINTSMKVLLEELKKENENV